MKLRSLLLAGSIAGITLVAAHADTLAGSAVFSDSNLVCTSTTCSLNGTVSNGGAFSFAVTDGVPYTDTKFLDITTTGGGSADLSLAFTITDPSTGSGTVAGSDTFRLTGAVDQGNFTWYPETITLANGQELTIDLNPESNANGANGTEFDATFTLGTPSTSVVPEPSTLALMGTGLLGFAGVIRRRFKA